MTTLETRSNSALMKRAEQLKRWQDSETFREPTEPRRKSRRIGFSDGCVFLAACAAGDREEVKVLLGRGADIDTANVDGLTALHQACIDDNLEMVEFLVSHGADVNRGDNEGWTPLHATASCGFLSIARFLIDHGANVAAVNNDGELAIDISESDEMEDLLQKEINVRNINCEDARNREEQCMLDDARDWLNLGKYGDSPHHKTGATALHVASAKGYIKVINLLIKGGADVNQQDFDGWTPLHAAAHWAQREACELLAENYVNMDIKNCVGQTAFDVADPDVLRLLEELKKKQNTLQKDNPTIKALINRPPTTPGLGKGGRRSSITRLSQQDKFHSTKEATVKETIKEEKVNRLGDMNESDKESTDTSESVKLSSMSSGRSGLDSPGVVVTDSEGKEAPGFLPPHLPDTKTGDENAPWRRPGSLRARPSGVSSGGKLSPSSEDLVTVRRAHSFGSDEKRKVSEDITTNKSPDLRPRSSENLTSSKGTTGATVVSQPAGGGQVRRSFVPPVRDEEHEIQRKAHAKRVRETRRSTQGVTLEDLKSAEQSIKKKQQAENAQRTTELNQLAGSSPGGSTATSPPSTPTPPPPGSTATGTTTATITTTTSDSDRHERRPSWRVRVGGDSDKSRFTLEESPKEETKVTNRLGTIGSPDRDRRLSARLEPNRGLEIPSDRTQHRHSTIGSFSPTHPSHHLTGTTNHGDSDGNTTPTQLTAVQRKKKPKRRSTGVVNLMEDEMTDPKSEDSGDEIGTVTNTSESSSRAKSNLKNGCEVDYKKLWEESQVENSRLRQDMSAIRSDLEVTRQQLDSAIQASAKNSVSDSEKREKKVLEKKLAEMEDELKTLDQLKADNQRLRDENGALIRVISKLSK